MRTSQPSKLEHYVIDHLFTRFYVKMSCGLSRSKQVLTLFHSICRCKYKNHYKDAEIMNHIVYMFSFGVFKCRFKLYRVDLMWRGVRIMPCYRATASARLVHATLHCQASACDTASVRSFSIRHVSRYVGPQSNSRVGFACLLH